MTTPYEPRETATDPAPVVPATPVTPAATPAPIVSADPAAFAASVTPVTPVVINTPPRKGRGGGALNVLLVVAVAVAVGGVAFAAGRSTAPVAAANGSAFIRDGAFGPGGSFAPGTGGARGPGGGLFASGGALTVKGTVASVDGTTLTLTLESGDTMTVKLDDTTTYHAATPATASDVAVGDDVAVQVTGAGRVLNGSGGGTTNGPTASGGTGGAAVPQLTAGDVTVVR